MNLPTFVSLLNYPLHSPPLSQQSMGFLSMKHFIALTATLLFWLKTVSKNIVVNIMHSSDHASQLPRDLHRNWTMVYPTLSFEFSSPLLPKTLIPTNLSMIYFTKSKQLKNPWSQKLMCEMSLLGCTSPNGMKHSKVLISKAFMWWLNILLPMSSPIYLMLSCSFSTRPRITLIKWLHWFYKSWTAQIPKKSMSLTFSCDFFYLFFN